MPSWWLSGWNSCVSWCPERFVWPCSSIRPPMLRMPSPQRIAVCRIGWRHGRHSFCQIVQDVRKQPIVEMHANGLAYVGGASAVQAERNSGFIKMSVETRRSLECSNIELVRIFERDLGFVGDGLGHGGGHLL